MSQNLNDVVRVVIFDQSQAITTASFQIPLILSAFTNFPERTRVYNSIQALGGDFESTSSVYKMAEKLFGQAGVLGAPIPSLVVGRRLVSSVAITPVVVNEATYTITLNDVDYSFTSDANATASEISAGLVAALGSIAGYTITDGLGNLTISTSEEDWSIAVSSNLAKVDAAPAETIV